MRLVVVAFVFVVGTVVAAGLSIFAVGLLAGFVDHPKRGDS